MTEFEKLIPEELASMETLYHSPAWKDFCKLLYHVGFGYEDSACKFLLMNDSETAAKLVERGQGILALIAMFEMKFNPEREIEPPEAKPKTFHELLP